MDALDAKLRLEVSRPVTILEDTGELRGLAEQIKHLENDPRRPGPLDFVLAAAGLAGLFTVGVCSLILAFAPDEYPIEAGRVLMTMAAAGFIVAPVMGACFSINRANRRRFAATMEKLDRIRCGCDGGARPPIRAVGRALSPAEYYKVYSDAMKDLGDLADGDSN